MKKEQRERRSVKFPGGLHFRAIFLFIFLPRTPVRHEMLFHSDCRKLSFSLRTFPSFFSSFIAGAVSDPVVARNRSSETEGGIRDEEPVVCHNFVRPANRFRPRITSSSRERRDSAVQPPGTRVISRDIKNAGQIS